MRQFHILLVFILTFLLSGCVKKQAYWENLRHENLHEDIDFIYSNAKIPTEPLTLQDILDITLERNLDLMVKSQEIAIQQEIATHEKLGLIPDLIAGGIISERDSLRGSSSESLDPSVNPAPPSFSSERMTKLWDLTFTWHLLDFGLSYYRSRQEVNRTLMECLEYKRLQQNLILNVIRQYWKAIVSKRALEKAKSLIDKAQAHINHYQYATNNKIVPKIWGLRNEQELIGLQIQLKTFQNDYTNANLELSVLMGLPPSCPYELADAEYKPIELVQYELDNLEEMALINRPELFASDIEVKINADEVRASFIKMFPNANIFGSYFHDENKFLVHNYWLEAGIRTSWNLLALPQYYNGFQIAGERKELARKNRIALSMGVIAQVHLIYLKYLENLDQYKLAHELEGVNNRILDAAEEEVMLGKLHDAHLLRYETETFFSEINALKAYAEMQNTLAQLSNTLGMPFLFLDRQEKGSIIIAQTDEKQQNL